MRRWVAAVVATLCLSCGRQVVYNSTLKSDNALWCLPVSIEVDGATHEAIGCIDTQALCEKAKEQASSTIASMWGVRSVGECSHR